MLPGLRPWSLFFSWLARWETLVSAQTPQAVAAVNITLNTFSGILWMNHSQAVIILILLPTRDQMPSCNTFSKIQKRRVVLYLLFLAKLCFQTNDFFVTANNNVCSKQRADNGSIIESTVILISGASLTLIKRCSLVVMGDNDNLNRAVTLDQTDVLPWQRGSVGLHCMWRIQDERRRRREAWRVERESRSQNQLGVSLALAFDENSQTKHGDRPCTILSEGQCWVRDV